MVRGGLSEGSDRRCRREQSRETIEPEERETPAPWQRGTGVDSLMEHKEEEDTDREEEKRAHERVRETDWGGEKGGACGREVECGLDVFLVTGSSLLWNFVDSISHDPRKDGTGPCRHAANKRKKAGEHTKGNGRSPMRLPRPLGPERGATVVGTDAHAAARSGERALDGKRKGLKSEHKGRGRATGELNHGSREEGGYLTSINAPGGYLRTVLPLYLRYLPTY